MVLNDDAYKLISLSHGLFYNFKNIAFCIYKNFSRVSCFFWDNIGFEFREYCDQYLIENIIIKKINK